MARRRNDIDDAALTALLDHRLRGMLGEKKRAAQYHRELALPLLEGHLDHALVDEYRRPIHQDIDSAKRRARRLDRPRTPPRAGPVARPRPRAPAGSVDIAR